MISLFEIIHILLVFLISVISIQNSPDFAVLIINWRWVLWSVWKWFSCKAQRIKYVMIYLVVALFEENFWIQNLWLWFWLVRRLQKQKRICTNSLWRFPIVVLWFLLFPLGLVSIVWLETLLLVWIFVLLKVIWELLVHQLMIKSAVVFSFDLLWDL